MTVLNLPPSCSVLMIGKRKWIISEVLKRRNKTGNSSPFPKSAALEDERLKIFHLQSPSLNEKKGEKEKEKEP